MRSSSVQASGAPRVYSGPDRATNTVHGLVGASTGVEESVNPVSVGGGQEQQQGGGGSGPLTGSVEYNTAMELEMWKLGEEEAFQVG